MAFKLKKGHKIALIILGFLFAVFLFLKIFLNIYLRKSLEEELNKILNAEVKIEKLDLKLFSAQLRIYNILIIGQGEFKNDTLINCEKLILDLENFDKKTNTIVFGNVLLDNLTIKNISSENHNLCWDNILNKKELEKNKADENIQDPKISLFVRKFILTDAIVEIIDRSTNEKQSLSDIQLIVNFNSNLEEIKANFDFECLYNSELTNKINCKAKGDFLNSENDLSAKTDLNFNDFPMNLQFSMNTDSLKNSKLLFSLISDLSKINSNINKYKGEISLELEAEGNLKNFNISNFNYSFLADSVIIQNKNSSDSVFVNFSHDFTFNTSSEFFGRNIFKNVNIYSNNQSLNGEFLWEISDSNYNINSNLNGEFNFESFAKILNLENNNFDFNLKALADLNYKYSMQENFQQGNFIISTNLKTPFFEFNNSEIKFINNEFVFYSDFYSEYSQGNFKLNSGEFANYIQQKPILFDFNIYFSNLIIPKFDFKKNKKPKIKSSLPINSIYDFSDKFILNAKCKIDSLNILEKNIFDIETIFKLNSESLSLKSNKITLDKGYLKFDLKVLKTEEDNLLISNFDLNNLDLCYFMDENSELSGFLNIKIDNNIYFGKNSSQSFGENKISLQDFEMRTDFLKDYGINEDKLKIFDFETKILLKNDSLNILPFRIKINELKADFIGNIDLNLEKIDFNILFDIPDDYLTKFVKLALFTFSKKSEMSFEKKQNRTFKLLKIEGDLENPKINLYD
ncbi:MAG: hypothetical protein M0P36_09060 [Bacteroidales bacterium]|nr:hypothetical protein [Bacteroidales bacterium]MDY0315408.1 hypothetical protein [Bacteroidales bacterium]